MYYYELMAENGPKQNCFLCGYRKSWANYEQMGLKIMENKLNIKVKLGSKTGLVKVKQYLFWWDPLLAKCW